MGRISYSFALILFLSVFPFISAFAQPDTGRAAVHPAKWDFGYLPQKSEVGHRFYFVNTGKDSLPVTRIKAGCACTSVSQIDDPIAPGDSTAIDIIFKSGRYHKQVKKTTRIFVLDPEEKQYAITLHAYVYKEKETHPYIKLVPRKLKWKIDRNRQPQKINSIKIINSGPETVRISILHSPDGFIDNIEVPDILNSGEKAQARFKIAANEYDEKSKGLSVTFGFIGLNTTIITVPIEIE